MIFSRANKVADLNGQIADLHTACRVRGEAQRTKRGEQSFSQWLVAETLALGAD
jgi:hypothetical protein